jgi:trehalose 6-phosphate synthase/phosphatase
MATLHSPAQLASLVLGALGPTRHLALLLDYDGTLVPIARRPELATADADLTLLLDRLASHPRISVAVVSGRALEDLRSVLGGTGRFYVFAEHGGVGAWPDGKVGPLIEHTDGDELERLRLRLKDVVWPEGVWVEEKQMALALHTREASRSKVPRAQDLFRQVVRETDASHRFDIMAGKEVLEVRPTGLDKGLVVDCLRDRLADVSPLVVAVGDDRTDEDAFARLLPTDFAVRVGEMDSQTSALFRLADPHAVRLFLHGVITGLT